MQRLLAFVLLCSALTGCGLIADFDRGKIPEEHGRGPDAGLVVDAGGQESPAQDEDAGDEDGG